MDQVAIPLTRGLFAVVDADDAALVAAHKWHAVPARSTYYAARRVGSKTIYMHRKILGLVEAASCVHVDHDDGDGLNNRRKNIRPCTPAQNSQKRASRKTPAGMRGVWPKGRRFVAQIGHAGKFHYLGSFSTQEAAQAAYSAAAVRLFGDFAPKGSS